MSQPESQQVALRWTDIDPARPALDVLVRLIALTDDAYEAGDLSAYWMQRDSDGTWSWTGELPADLRTTYQLCPVRDQPARGRQPDEDRWLEILATGVPDPLASRQLPGGTVWGNPGPASVLALPAALPQPWLAARDDVAPGGLKRVEVGDSVVQVWEPGAAERLPVVISFDGGSWVRTDAATTFANLVADEAVPPFLGVLVESIHGSTERGPTRVRSLTHPDQFADFVLAELLPYLRVNYPVADDRVVLAGQSLGALAAAHVAAVAPGEIGWVIGQSAALWWPGDDSGGLSGEAVIAAYDDPAVRAVRFFLEVGTEEGDELRQANDRFREVLAGNGNSVGFREFRGGHDHACWQGGLADGIVAALRRITRG